MATNRQEQTTLNASAENARGGLDPQVEAAAIEQAVLARFHGFADPKEEVVVTVEDGLGNELRITVPPINN